MTSIRKIRKAFKRKNGIKCIRVVFRKKNGEKILFTPTMKKELRRDMTELYRTR